MRMAACLYLTSPLRVTRLNATGDKALALTATGLAHRLRHGLAEIRGRWGDGDAGLLKGGYLV